MVQIATLIICWIPDRNARSRPRVPVLGSGSHTRDPAEPAVESKL